MSGLSLYGSGLTITEAQGPNFYLGTWNASTNTPALASSTAPAGPAGSYYIVSVAGTTTLNGISDWTVGDWVIWNGSVWQKLEGGAAAITIGSTAIAGGTSGRVLYDNAGALGEYTITGTAGSVVMSNTPTITSPVIGSTTWANIPAAGTAGKMVFVSNAGTKGSMWLDDGTRWKPLNGIAPLASSDTTSANVANSETIVMQGILPAGMWQTSDSIRIFYACGKSGGTDTGVLRVRIGTAGTTADTSMASFNMMQATIRQCAAMFDFRLESATSVQPIPVTASIIGYNGSGSATTAAVPAAVTISSAASNQLYVSVSILSGGATDTVNLVGGHLQIVSKSN